MSIKSDIDAMDLIRKNSKLTDDEFVDYLIYVSKYHALGVLTHKGTDIFKKDKEEITRNLKDAINIEERELAEYKAEKDRTASRCTSCGSKHWNNATLCTSCCDREVFGR